MKALLPKTRPVSVRFTEEELKRVAQKTGDMPLSAYIRFSVLSDDSPLIRTRGKRPVKDHQALAQVLAAFGASRIANNLNQLAKAANSGSLPITPETEAILNEACAAIMEIRRVLMQALGLHEEDSP